MDDKVNSIAPETTEISLSERSVASRERILDAALIEFAEHGLGGARVDMIAERAGINKRMLYQYVGNKESLWLATLERVYDTMRSGEQALHLEALEPEDGMCRLVRYKFRVHVDRPEFLSILNEENRQRAKNIKNSGNVPEMYSPLLSVIASLLQRGEKSGVFRDGVDPMELYISITALGYFYCSNRYTLSAIFQRDLCAEDELLQRENHIVEVVMGYLRRQ